MKNNGRKLIAGYIVTGLLSLVNIAAYILCIVNLNRNYKYFYITSPGRFLLYSFMMVLPFIAGLLIVLFLKKMSRKTRVIMYTVFGVSLALSVVFTVFMGIMTPCASRTEDPANYLKSDINSNTVFRGLFPEEIPKEAENIKYYYNFTEDPDRINEVFVQFTLPKEQYEAEKKRLAEKFHSNSSEQIANYVLIYLSSEDKTDYDYNFYAYNDFSCTLRYVSSYIQNVDVNGVEPYYASLKWG